MLYLVHVADFVFELEGSVGTRGELKKVSVKRYNKKNLGVLCFWFGQVVF